MRPALVAIVLALFVQKPVWADQLFMPPETVFYCEMTNHPLILAGQPSKLMPLERFKMKVSKAQGEVTFSGETMPGTMSFLKYREDTSWTANEPRVGQAFASFSNGALAFSVLFGYNGKPSARVVLATCEEF